MIVEENGVIQAEVLTVHGVPRYRRGIIKAALRTNQQAIMLGSTLFDRAR